MLAPAALFLSGPDVLRTATGELATVEALGGATLHVARTGIADAVFTDEIEMLLATRDLLDLLPSSAAVEPPHRSSSDPADRETPAPAAMRVNVAYGADPRFCAFLKDEIGNMTGNGGNDA